MSDEPGLYGDGELRAGKYNMRLVERAIRRGWNVPDDVKQRVVKQMAKIVRKSEEERNQIAAARVLVSADSVDVAREKMEQPGDGGSVTNNTQINNFHVHPALEQKSDDELLRIISETEGIAGPVATTTGAIEVPARLVSPSSDGQTSGVPGGQ